MLTISVVVACSSVESDPSPAAPSQLAKPPAPPPRPLPRIETEVARASIGPGGGTVSGGGATIEVPDGALAADTTIVIKTLDPVDVTLPLRGRLAGAVYAFEPDDVVFLKPVRITIAVSPPANGRGVIMLLRSPKALSNWEARGGGAATRSFVEARTDHFSDWAPVSAEEEACLLDVAACPADEGAGIDCSVPATNPSVHCAGAAGAYACTCFGRTAVIATFDEVPPASALSALALACGSSCEDADGGGLEDASIDADAGDDAGDDASSACEPVVACEPWAGPDAGADDPDGGLVAPGSGWRCTTLSTTRSLSCHHVDGTTTATCRCGADAETLPDGGDAAASETSFTIAATDAPPSEAQFVRAWRDHCAGLCVDVTTDAGADGACPDDGGCALERGTPD